MCQERVTGEELKWVKHGAEHHPNHFLQGFAVKHPDPKFSEKKYWCPLDNNWYESRKYLARTIKLHGWTNARYYQTYGKEFMPNEWAVNENDPTVGNAHNTNTCLHCCSPTPFQEGKWKYPAFCGYQCSTKWYAENTSRTSKAMTTLRERKALDPNHHLRPNQKRYWLNNGLTEDEAVEKVKERNAVNSLERYIERAGGDVELGTKNWSDRQERWQATLNAKPEEEKARINRLKVEGGGRIGTYSTKSKKLFDRVEAIVPGISYGANEPTIRLRTMFVKPDCLLGNKVIEFFGDYWHANPIKYGPLDKVARSGIAQDVWEKDKRRVEEYALAGYQVLIIWESEYIQDPDGSVNKCVDFLRKGNATKNSN